MRWRSRRPAVLVLAAIVAVAAPFLVAIARSDLATTRELDRLTSVLPRSTAVLKAQTSVTRTPEGCRGVSAKMLASELGVREIAEFYEARNPADAIGALPGFAGLAWSTPGSFWVRRLEAGSQPRALSPQGDGGMPGLVRRLLSQWTVLPSGVRRVVVFRSFAIDTTLDPRCLGG